MLRFFVRPVVPAAALLLLAEGLAAQSAASPRLLAVPQLGAAIQQSRGAQMTAMASFAAEVPVGRGISLTAEGTTALGDYALTVCRQPELPCGALVQMRSGAAVGVMARPFQWGRVAPYAGVSGGLARWARADLRGTAPLASLRAGVDVRVAGPFGVRADLARRVFRADEADGSAVHADMLSLGASFALRR
jgi:hypothetical protein